MTPGLRVARSGMCCAVGLSAPAARAAIRAGLDRFVASEFVDERGAAIVVARLPLGDVWGPRRLGMMFEAALAECVEGALGFDPARTAVILIVAEKGRPGYSDAWARACFASCERVFGAKFHAESRIVPLGRAGLATALRDARALLAEEKVKHVVVAGVDSYLNAHTISHFLRKGRIQCAGTSDGFIPGEGAGVLLVDLAAPDEPGLRVLGTGIADEPAIITSDEPQRALGLTDAIAAALSESGHRLNDLDFRMADVSGESFYFREAALADTRLLDHRTGRFPLCHITDSIGETGAAVGPLSVAFLLDAMPRGHVPGTRAVAHFANDGGARSAVVLEHVTS